MSLYEVPLSMSLLGFEMGTMLANVHMCDIMMVLRAVFNMLVRNASPRGLILAVVLVIAAGVTASAPYSTHWATLALCFSLDGLAKGVIAVG